MSEAPCRSLKRRPGLARPPKGFRGTSGGNELFVVRIGCSGWSYAHWRGVLYPKKGSTASWLELYAQRFDTVEVNATFYRLPTRVSVERWASGTPESFCFAVKASRYLTHVRRLTGLDEGLRRLEERIGPLRSTSKLRPMLWQLDGRFHRDQARLAAALERLPEGRHAFEFRHDSWFVDDVYELLRTHRVALVVADRAPAGPTPWVPTCDWAYIRFHSGRGRNGVYTRSQISEWAGRLAAFGGDVYAYFNNDWEALAVKNAEQLRDAVEVVPEGARSQRALGTVRRRNRRTPSLR
jgi:uncharacterized protein YecE (DUF72 family)